MPAAIAFQTTDGEPVYLGNVKYPTELWRKDIIEINLSDFAEGTF